MAGHPIHIKGFLKPEELAEIRSILTESTFEDGKKTAFGAALSVKNNLQLPRGDTKNFQRIQAIIGIAINESPLLQAIAIPKFFVPPLVSRYEPGHAYGFHVDSPLMGSDGQTLRTDLAMTIFISDADAYDGGELSIHLPTGESRIKFPAGDAVIYPTEYVHGVLPVIRGTREVVVTWIQSHIRDGAQRDIISKLKTLETLYQQKLPGAAENLSLQQVYSNLMRMWST